MLNRTASDTLLRLAGIAKWQNIAGEAAGHPLLVYGGDASFEREPCRVLSWRDFVDEHDT